MKNDIDRRLTQNDSMSACDLSVDYGDRRVIEGVDVSFPRGQVTTIVGANGCGKSTLLKAMSRLIPVSGGEVLLNGRDISTIKRKDLAQTVSVLPQSPTAPEGLNVADLVSRGRHPHQSWIRQWSSTDEAEVYRALDMTGSLALAERTVDSLSGGQRQRVWISMVLAQNTEILFLDEPTTYLDLATSVEILELVRNLRRELDRTVVMVLHDLNLAVRYSDNLVVMKGGQILATGHPRDVVTSELLLEAFALDALVAEDPITGGPLVVPR
ncbi:ATP-binding cassette domain-containing protein [Corynebacterium sp. zg254]|uniref:ABC transporter ATP-binding protein n=1 Tax=Corynebacterium zhongnanshanii TaxID=2768834 RepID=A0ABQ6VF49_9CORY|nr:MULTISPECIES: ABC transporter ATP-binding protein [Corynebacterium]KAB3522849.1 ABC transporter ATP-binding protein [Corynebacterium zhongnanshanii]MCR5914080.1 ATP-binding cassette domain-containing protein [Corynebacterium sp. zg254]